MEGKSPRTPAIRRLCPKRTVYRFACSRAGGGLHRCGYAGAENADGFAVILDVRSARCSCAARWGPQWSRGIVAGGMRREFHGLRGVGLDMKSIARSLVVILVALIAVPALAVSVTITDSRSATGHDGVDHGRHPASAVDPTGSTRLSSPNYMDLADQQLHRSRVPDVAPRYPRLPWSTPRSSSPSSARRRSTTRSPRVAAISTVASEGGTVQRRTLRRPRRAATETHFAIFGYSQSAVVASLVKKRAD